MARVDFDVVLGESFSMLIWQGNILHNSTLRLSKLALVALGLAACGSSPPVTQPSSKAAATQTIKTPSTPTDPEQSKCDGGDRDACFALSVELFYGRNGHAKDQPRSFALFKKLCDSAIENESSNACFNVGVAYEQAHGVERDLSAATAYYERACNMSNADGCDSAGDAYELGEGVPRDLKHAKALFESGCKLDDANSCLNVAFTLIKLDASNPEVFSAYSRACDAGSMQACHNVAANYANGERTGRDLGRAKLMFTHACDQGFQDSCEAKQSMERDQSYQRTAAQMSKLEKSCQVNKADKQGCNDLGYMYWNGINVAGDEKKAANWYEIGCQKSDGDSCYQLAMIVDDDTQNTAKMKRALQLYERACSLNSGGACYNFGIFLERGTTGPIDLPRAFQSFVKACSIGDKKVCSAVASAYSQAKGVEKNMAMAAIHYELSCGAGKGGACYNMGVYYENGTGVAKDQERANAKFAQACKLGDDDGCKAMNASKEAKGNDPDSDADAR
jgi:uncharacterized protein